MSHLGQSTQQSPTFSTFTSCKSLRQLQPNIRSFSEQGWDCTGLWVCRILSPLTNVLLAKYQLWASPLGPVTFSDLATILAVRICWWTGQYCSTQDLQLRRTISGFPSPNPWVPPGTVSSQQQEGASTSAPAWFLCPASKVYSVFSNRVSPSNSSTQPRAMAAARIVLGI